jgi:hypothetical protein
MEKRTIILICLILGLSAVACTFVWCRYHRYYVVGSGARIYLVDRLRGETWFLAGGVRWRVEDKGMTISEYNRRLHAGSVTSPP